MKNLDQVRAARAYAALERARDEEADHAIKLPVMLRTNGLLATWAFLVSRYEKTAALLGAMTEHLRATEGLGASVAEGSADEVFRQWIGTPQEPGLGARELRDLTAEAIALAGWLKRAAESRPPAGSRQEGDRG